MITCVCVRELYWSEPCFVKFNEMFTNVFFPILIIASIILDYDYWPVYVLSVRVIWRRITLKFLLNKSKKIT